MIKNYYYLIAGLLSILFSFTHAWFGQTKVLTLTDASNIDLATKTAVFYTWHMSTVENLIFGIAFIIMALYKDLSKVKFAAWLIVVIVIGHYALFIGSTLIKNSNGLKDASLELIVLIIYILLIILGINKRDEFPHGYDF
jgi:hypothetical protein